MCLDFLNNLHLGGGEVKRRKWNWIGHTLCKETGEIEKTALDWDPQGQRRRGRLKRT